MVPSLPSGLEPLRAITFNLRWAWDHDSIDLFRRLDPPLWDELRNPVLMLDRCEQRVLEAADDDPDFHAHLRRVLAALEAYLAHDGTWFERTHGAHDWPVVAYFSAEFGVTDSLSIFAGGLGMLAGNHLKSASDLGVPLVGVGLLYQQGYFEQRLNDDGWQQESTPENDFHTLPLTLERDSDGGPLTVSVGLPDGPLVAQIWRADVGRMPLYLLNANTAHNSADQRRVTHHLYGGDEDMRIRQEILLGIGGLRALAALGIEPVVCHMNEGHSAFLSLERTRRVMQAHELTFAEAREAATPALVFTTHTPVEAGHDYFPPELMERYFAGYAADLGVEWDDFLALGRADPDDATERFCMTILALTMAGRSNGVSRLHGSVSRTMWQGLWAGLPEHEVPIGSVTNGVHLTSWTSHEMSALYDRYLGAHWREEPGDEEHWRRLEGVAPEELWETHEIRRRKLVEFVRRRLRLQADRRGAARLELATAETALDPSALTIGFVRRFATYKRATLLMSDVDRLARLLGDPERPVQVIVAGKAHPRDEAGKELIRRIAQLAREEPFRGKLVFVEDYGMAVARYLVQGCDVWLNNPLRPREASGTSGMKAAANGGLNFSTLDGWWDEAWIDRDPDAVPFGWAIGNGDVHADLARQDREEATSLYATLEHDIIPTFYDRHDGLPWSWIARMKASIERLSPVFNTHRMLREYTERYYLAAYEDARRVGGDSLRLARELAVWRERVDAAWSSVQVVASDAEGPITEVQVGEGLQPRAHVTLNGLTPDDVAVELYLGRVGVDGTIVEGEAIELSNVGVDGDRHVYEASPMCCRDSGRYGYTLRVRARHPQLGAGVRGCVTWAQPL